MLRTIEAFKVFDIVYVMTGGGPASGTQTVAFYADVQAFSNQLFGYGRRWPNSSSSVSSPWR